MAPSAKSIVAVSNCDVAGSIDQPRNEYPARVNTPPLSAVSVSLDWVACDTAPKLGMNVTVKLPAGAALKVVGVLQ